MRKRIFVILMLLWMVLIFCFSARSGDTSEQDSYRVGMVAGKIFVPGFAKQPEAQQIAFAAKVDHLIRKTAHATEYAILGIFIVGAYVDRRKSRGEMFLGPWILSTGYAATDEFHQLFVPGRSGQMKDVMIDSGGAALGIGIVVALLLVKKGLSEKNLKGNQR